MVGGGRQRQKCWREVRATAHRGARKGARRVTWELGMLYLNRPTEAPSWGVSKASIGEIILPSPNYAWTL